MKIDNVTIDRITECIIERLKIPQTTLEASGRHVHLTTEAVDILFGPGYQLTRKAPLSQPGQFSCKERLQVIGPKGSFPNVIVLGPERKDCQVEVSLTDARQLGVEVPVRLSGDIAGTPGIRLVGPKGELELSRGLIIAKRHIHMTPGYAKLYGFSDHEVVCVKVEGERGLIFDQVVIRVSSSFADYMHIDYDEANACGFHTGMTGVILKQNE